MAKLRVASMAMPCSYGLNLEDTILADQAKRFASEASNAVVDTEGRLGSRQYFINQTSAFTSNLLTVAVYKHSDAVETTVSATNSNIYTGLGTLTSRSSGHSNGNWQFAGLSGKLFAAQASHTPIVFHGGTFATESFTGAPWSNGPNIFMAAYGRLWAADDSGAATPNRYTIWFSNLLDGKVWNAGDAGSLSLINAWPKGNDNIIALAAQSNRLYVFGQTQLLQYTMPANNDPDSMTLADTAEIGLVARDAVTVTDQGIYFLAQNGLYRIDKSAQITSLLTLPPQSRLVNGDLLSELAAETLTSVRMGYYPKEGWVLLTFPTSAVTYCIHTRRTVEGVNVPVITKWTHTDVAQRGFTYNAAGDLLCAGVNGVHKYTGYTAGSNSFSFSFYTQWLGDGGEELNLKALALVLETDSGQTGTARWRTDFKEGTTYTATFTCSAVEFAEAPGIGEVIVDLSESGGSAKIGATFTINGDAVSIHSLRIYSTGGALKF